MMGTGYDLASLNAALQVARYEYVDVMVSHAGCHFLCLGNTFVIEFAWCLSLHDVGCIVDSFAMTNQV